ncbi:MAG: hypothetical protein ACE5JT_00850 [Nitrosopumilaceae archaeon]
MKRALLVASLVILLIPISISFAQLTDTQPTLSVRLTSTAPYSFKAPDGSTMILGEIENTNSFPVTGVKIFAGFYDINSEQPLETAIGTTLLDIVPPNSKTPYIISSKSKNAAITNISVNLIGFNSAPIKQQVLTISPGTLRVGNQLVLSGTITNEGEFLTNQTRVHLISYDAFERIVAIASAEAGDIDSGSSIDFEISSDHNALALSYKIVAESENYQSIISDLTDVRISTLTKLVTISEVLVTDPEDNKFSEIQLGSPVHITSKIWLKYAADPESTVQPYVCYVQIKQIGAQGSVEFIGVAEGKFDSAGTQFPTVVWDPEHEGAFFIEVYVWDPKAVPLSTPSTDINLVLVTS